MRNVHLADQPKGDHLAEHHSHHVRRGVLARLAPIAIVVAALALIIALVGTPGHDGEPSALARAPRHAHVPSSQASARTESNPRVNVTIASRPSGISRTPLLPRDLDRVLGDAPLRAPRAAV